MNQIFSLFCIILFVISTLYQHCCTQKVSFVIDIFEDKINGSLEIEAEEFLWHVAVLKQEETVLVFLCGGTVIHGNLVITAASCVLPVVPSELKVVAGLNFLHNTLKTVENPHSIYSVTGKYYPYHSNGSNMKNDIAILKLHEKIQTSPQLTALSAATQLSKRCFTLGWGVKINEIKGEEKCPNPMADNALYNSSHLLDVKRPTLSNMLSIRNNLGINSMFMFTLKKIFKTFTGLDKYESEPKMSQELICRANENSQLKVMWVSAKHLSKCLRTDNRHLCLYSHNSAGLTSQVDVGSPLFCKVKKSKSRNSCPRVPSSNIQFVLAGIITSKSIQHTSMLKHNSTISFIKASNITHFKEFLFAVLQHKP